MSRNYFQHSNNYKTLTGLRGGTSEQRFDTSLLPSVTDTYDLGSGTLKWQEVFANKVEALGGESRFTSIDVSDTMRTNDLVVTGETTYNVLSANDADIAALKVTNVNAQTSGAEILVGDDMRLGADEILYTNKIRSNPAGGTVTVYDNLTVLGTLNYTLPPAPSAVFGTLSDTEIGDLVTDPMDASPPEAADSNLQPAAERVLSAPTINATQWISTPFLTLMGLAQTDKLKVTSDKIPASKTDFNNSAFWNEGGAILQGRTYIDAECIPQTLSVVSNATVGGTLGVSGATTFGAALQVTGAGGLPGQNNTGNAYFVGGQGGGNSGRAIIGDGTGWAYRFANRISSTTTDVVTISDRGYVTASNTSTGGEPGGASYNNIRNSFATFQSSHAHSAGDHSGTLLVLDNNNPAGSSGGVGGSVVFGGPYQDLGSGFSKFQGAAGRIRGITNSGAYGGSLTLETVAAADGGMFRRMTIDGAGQVGINTTTPGRRFDVNGVSRSTQLEVEASGTSISVTPRKRQAADTDGWVTLDPSGGGNTVATTGVYVWGSAAVEGTFEAGDTTIQKAGTDLRILPQQRRDVLTNGWVTLDPNGGDNTVDGTGVAVWGSCDVSGDLRSLKTGAATSTTAGPNRFAGGIAVNAGSVLRETAFANPDLGPTNLILTPGSKGGVPTIGWTSIDPNGVGAASSGTFFFDQLEVSDRVTCLNGVTSSLTGDATNTTSGPNLFGGGIACNGNSVFKSLTIADGLNNQRLLGNTEVVNAATVEFGAGVTPAKQTNAGRIQYVGGGTFNHHLAIFGGATAGSDRLIRLFDNFECNQTGTMNTTQTRVLQGNWPNSTAPATFVVPRPIRTLGGQNQTWNANDLLPGTFLQRTSITNGCVDKIPTQSAIIAAFGDASPPVGTSWEINLILFPSSASDIYYLTPLDSSVEVFPFWIDGGNTARHPSIRGYSCVSITVFRISSSFIRLFVNGQAGALGIPDQ